MAAEPVGSLTSPSAVGEPPAAEPSAPGGEPKVVVALHDGFYGASSGTGFSNRALLEVLASALPPGRLLVLPTPVPHTSPAFDQHWTSRTQRLLDSVAAQVVPVRCPHPGNAGARVSETLCRITGEMVGDLVAGSSHAHVIGLDFPFLGLAPHVPDSRVSLLLVPRSTSKLAAPADHRRIQWERGGLTAAVTRGDRIAAISRHMRAHLTHQYRVPARAIVDLHNGLLLNDRLHRPAPVLVPPRARGGFLLAMGRAVRSKGFEDLLAAVSLLRPHGVRLPHLLLAATSHSSPPTQYQQHLHAQVRELGVDATVFTRFSPAYQTWLHSRSLRAVVVPSRAEPFGRIPLEAFAAGAGPVVATRVGGLMETVVDGEIGFTAEPNDPADLADAIHHALRVTARDRDRLRRRGQALLASRHDYGATIRSYVRDHIPWALESAPAGRRTP